MTSASPTILKSSRTFIRKGLKIAIAGSIVGLGAYAVLSEQGFVASDNAVVSAYTVSVRSPIDGYISGISVGVGSPVMPGVLLATVENPRADDGRVSEQRIIADRLGRQGLVVIAQIDALQKLGVSLRARSEDHTRALGERQKAQVNEAELSLGVRKAQRDLLSREADRRTSLQKMMAGAPVDAERARGSLEVANLEVAAAQAHYDALAVQGSWTARGVSTDDSGNDVAYSTQRVDEIALRIADLTRQSADLASQRDEVLARLSEMVPRLLLLGKADLKAPGEGMVWKLGAADGERVGIGEMAAEIVDCNKAFIIAAVPQDRFPDIKMGAMARFRLSGERQEREGRVLSITGVGSIGRDRHLAATPIQTDVPNAMVVLAVSPVNFPGGECLVGRTARVLIPVIGGGFIERLTRRFM